MRNAVLSIIIDITYNLHYLCTNLELMVLRRFLLIGLLFLFISSVSGNKKKEHVLILNSATFNEHWSASFLESLYAATPRTNFIFDTFELKVPLLESEEDAVQLRRKLLETFPGKPAAVVFIGDPGWVVCAPVFDREWKDVPVVVCYSRPRLPVSLSILLNKEELTDENTIPAEEFNKNYNVTVFRQHFYVERTLKLMQQIIPEMNKLVFISDNRYVSILARREIRRVIGEKFPGLELIDLCNKNMSTIGLLDSLVSFDRHAGILYYSWFLSHPGGAGEYLENNA